MLRNNEINNSIVYYTNMNNNLYDQRINVFISNLQRIEKQYENMMAYANSILKCNCYFERISEFERFLNNQCYRLDTKDPRKKNLESLFMPLSKLKDDYGRNLFELKKISVISKDMRQSDMNQNQNKNISENGIGYKIIYIVGIIMVLIGVSIFGKYVLLQFLTNAVKAILLYILGILILGLSEFIIKKKNISFCRGITILGVCELYISTMISCTYLDIMNMYVAGAFIFLISVLTVLYSYREKSSIIRCFALASGILSLICTFNLENYQAQMNNLQAILIVSYIVIINMVNLILPIKQEGKKLYNFILYSQLINYIILLAVALIINKQYISILCGFFILVSLFINKFINKNSVNCINDYGIIYISIVAAFAGNIYSLLCMIILSILIIAICKNDIRYNSIVSIMIYLIKAVTLIDYGNSNIKFTTFILIFGISMIALAKLYSVNHNLFYSVCLYVGILILIIIEFVGMHIDGIKYAFGFKRTDIDMLLCFIQSLILIATCIISKIICRKNNTCYTTIKYLLMISFIPLAFYTNLIFKQVTGLDKYFSVFIALYYLLFMTISTMFEFLRNKSYKIENAIITFGLILFSVFFLASPVKVNLLLFFALVYLTLYIFTKDQFNNLFTKVTSKAILLNIVGIVYLFDVCRINSSFYKISFIIVDILVMVMACVNLYKGFKCRIKELRITGVAMTFIVLGKVIFYDNYGLNEIQNAILFTVIGVLAIVFAYIYSCTLKKMDITANKERVNNTQYNNFNNNPNNSYNMNQNQNNNYNHQMYNNMRNNVVNENSYNNAGNNSNIKK